MMKHIDCRNCSESCPVTSAKAAISFAFNSAVRFFSVLRFYFYYFTFIPKRLLV